MIFWSGYIPTRPDLIQNYFGLVFVEHGMGEGSGNELSKLESSTMEWRRRKLGDPMLGLQLV